MRALRAIAPLIFQPYHQTRRERNLLIPLFDLGNLLLELGKKLVQSQTRMFS
jgi:hypothetical protein